MADSIPASFPQRQLNVPRLARKLIKSRKFYRLIIAILVLGVGALSYTKFRSNRITGRLVTNKSLAILHFENLNDENADAYFADGIEDGILTRLAGIAELKVVSGISTQYSKSAPEKLPAIARQLGVTDILQGSVRKSRPGVRVDVKLIDAASGSQLWTNTFDCTITEAVSLERDVARAVAAQLGLRLNANKEQTIAAKSTENPEAYDAYLRALADTRRTKNTPTNYLDAQKHLRKAVRLDPQFALAWALLSYVDSRGYGTLNLQPTAVLREEARQSAEIALALEPLLGEAWVAKGYYNYGCTEELAAAKQAFEKAKKFLPNSSRIPESLAFIARRSGQWDRSDFYFKEAERLDPRSSGLLASHAQLDVMLRHFPEAMRKIRQILEIAPGDIDASVEAAAIAQARGDLSGAAAVLAPLRPVKDDPTAWEVMAYQGILERRPAPIIASLQEILVKPDPALGYLNGELRFWLGWLQEVAGDEVGAQETWREARRELETELIEQPENTSLLQDLALVEMSLGDKVAAFSLVDRGLAIRPIGKDAANFSQTVEILARVAARMQEPARAIAALQEILTKPGNGALAIGTPLTPAVLRLDPMFDSLRNDPRFQKLISSLQ